MKKIGKILSVMLVIVLLMTQFAFGMTTKADDGYQKVLDKANELLNFIFSYPEIFELENIDVTQLYLSDPIPFYIVDKDKVTAISRNGYAVLSSSNDVVGVIFGTKQEETGDVLLDFTTSYCEILTEKYNEKNSFVISQENLYLSDGTEVVSLSDGATDDEILGELRNLITFFEGVSISKENKVNVTPGKRILARL